VSLEKPCNYTGCTGEQPKYCADVPSNFRQEVVYVQYDAAIADFWAKVGEERVAGLQQITRALAATGWQITTSMPLSWSSAVGSGGASFAPTSDGGVMEFILFVVKDTGGGIGRAKGSTPPPRP
jgi:hypothetical protein